MFPQRSRRGLRKPAEQTAGANRSKWAIQARTPTHLAGDTVEPREVLGSAGIPGKLNHLGYPLHQRRPKTPAMAPSLRYTGTPHRRRSRGRLKRSDDFLPPVDHPVDRFCSQRPGQTGHSLGPTSPATTAVGRPAGETADRAQLADLAPAAEKKITAQLSLVDLVLECEVP